MHYRKLIDVADILNGYAFKSKEYVEQGIRIIRIANVQDGCIVDEQPCFYPMDSKKSIEKYMLSNNDLLISLTGNVGRVGVLNGEMLPAALNQRVGCIRIKNEKVLKLKYLFYFLRRKQFIEDAIKASRGVAQLNLSTKWLETYLLPIPSLDEQQRIVVKIEELFSNLDASVAELQTAKEKLKIYRQAVLKEAFEGNENWEKCVFGDLIEVSRNGYGKKPDDIGYYKILRISAVRAMSVNLHDYRLNQKPFEMSDLIETNDLLFTRYNGSVDYVGVCARVPPITEHYAYPDKIIKCVLKTKSETHAKFLQYYMNSGEARKFIRSQIKTTSGQNGIASSDIKKTIVYLPELKQQEKIVQEIESRLSVCDNIETTIDTALQQAEVLRQSILKQAFEGKLI